MNKTSEVTVYSSKDEEEYRSVLSSLAESHVPCRPWTTEEVPVFGHTILDPRKMGRKEDSLRRIYHIDVEEREVMRANIAVRRGVERIHPGTSLKRRPPVDVI